LGRVYLDATLVVNQLILFVSSFDTFKVIQYRLPVLHENSAPLTSLTSTASSLGSW